MQNFTVFCTEQDRSPDSTIWIASVEAGTSEEAAILGRACCADDWGLRQAQVRVIGVAEGNVKILEWSDEGIELPAPEVFSHLLVEVDSYPGADFSGSRQFMVTVDDEGGLSGEDSDLRGLLEELDIDDDPSGELWGRVLTTMRQLLKEVDDGQQPKRLGLVLCSGRRQDPDDSASKIEEVFDVTVWLKAVFSEDCDDE